MRKTAILKTIIVSAALLLTGGCIGVKYVSIEQYAPPRYLLPPDASRIAVLNNVDSANMYVINPNIEVWLADGDSIMEYVAQALADSELFSEVIVLDSCIFPKGNTVAHSLTQQEVQEYCNMLGVDIIMTCEFGGISTYRNYSYAGPVTWYNLESDEYFLFAHVYAPTRKDPFYSLKLEESWSKTVERREKMPEAVHEALPLIGEASVKYFLPYWDLRERSFYWSTNYNLREATISVKEGDWDTAFSYWQKYGKSRKARRRLISCYNQALYYEMQDSLDLAFNMLREAKSYVTDSTALDSAQIKAWGTLGLDYTGADDDLLTDYQRIRKYEQMLTERKAEITKLKLLEP